MQCSNDKNWQVSGGLQGPVMLALTSVKLLKVDLLKDWELAGELELQSDCHRYFCQPVELLCHALTLPSLRGRTSERKSSSRFLRRAHASALQAGKTHHSFTLIR